ncbi:Putative molybdenum carrier [Legionella busanensis]|uniref:Molybdenum carrier n=1 Tax=Legionella busanensis TaxID=190655 RepID=A0A378JH09_9GAMM|nr:putative molybdenum carrier protein [Legionella busanensis]STX49988.1 Putative molybdenum carrier [Legionella busanensis]
MVDKIVSGGQTGVDQAALKVASKLGFMTGGWCVKGGLDENGSCILNYYPTLQETTTSNLAKRTKLNVRDSDGTLIIVPNWPWVNKKDVTCLTLQEAIKQHKPYLIINLMAKKDEINNLKEWVSINNISILNIGGPRESSSPGIYKETYQFLKCCLPNLKQVSNQST